MPQKERKRQDVGKMLVLVETESGSQLYKRCAGPCGVGLKPLSEFNKDKTKIDGLHARCRECTKVHGRAYRKAGGRSNHANAPRQGCVYIVQLLDRLHVLKIGHTYRLARRLWTLTRRYGALQGLYVIPIDAPRGLERHLHAQLKAFRLYEGAKESELFQFGTKAARQAFRKATAPYAAHAVAPPSWERVAQERDDFQQQFAFG